MDVTTALAILGAATGSVSLYLEVRRWLASRTQIKLEVNPGTGPLHRGKTDRFGNEVAENAEVVFIQITNKSPYPVKISVVSAVDADDSERGFFFPRPYPVELPMPFEIPARDNRTLWVSREGLDAERLRFSVRTAGGESFSTNALVLDELPQWTLHDPRGRLG